MSFISAIFPKKLGSSYVRKWAKKQQRKVRHSNEISLDDVFAGMIFGISSFRKGSKTYSGDASLFELACYFLFETDLWLYNYKSKYRKDILAYLAQRLNELFSYALKMDNIPDLIVDRLKQYGKIAIEEDDAEKYVGLLSALVIRTKYNALPQEYELKDSKSYEDDIFDDFKLKSEISLVITHMLNAHYQVLENFFSLYDTDE